jgi:hypothetical protein
VAAATAGVRVARTDGLVVNRMPQRSDPALTLPSVASLRRKDLLLLSQEAERKKGKASPLSARGVTFFEFQHTFQSVCRPKKVRSF